MINPYSTINWQTVNKIMSCSHEHCETQQQFETLLGGDIEHIAISNYYPSKPVYPLSELFSNIPSSIIASPNAEHHSMNVGNLHINGLGSFFTSGKPRGEIPVGCNGAKWSFIISSILNSLQYSDGGGVTINHPIWSNLSLKQVLKMLDYDQRVLGIEIYNQTSEEDNSTGWALDLWDDILITGRRCWGFAVADHGGQINANWKGRNILLVPTITEHECLKAYRNGAFYTQINNTTLSFSEISVISNSITVNAPNAKTIKIIINGKTISTVTGETATITIPSDAIYCRVEAANDEDRIFSNPIMIKEKTYPYNVNIRKTTTKILLGLE